MPRKFKYNKSLIILLTILLSVGLYFFINRYNEDNSSRKVNVEEATSTSQQSWSEKRDSSLEEAKEPEFDSEKIQAIVNSWAGSYQGGGEASVAVMDTDGKMLASYNKDKEYFTASIYKLFVAHEGYKQLYEGKTQNEDEYIAGYTRLECLDAMIRSSYSPCAEAMWAEIGKQNLTDIMQSYGISNTSLVGLTTTAEDTALILQRIYVGKDIGTEFHDKYLDSMLTQDSKFRRGLPSGFSNAVQVFNKVGWNEQVEWHDGAILKFSEGRVLIVAVLTKSVGTNNISKLGSLLESAIVTN